MKMTTMKDQERLDLLKEIGGTKVYEERRKESLEVMKETEGRRKRIEEVVSTHVWLMLTHILLCNCAVHSMSAVAAASDM